MTDIKLYGRIFIRATIVAQTGMHIGGSGAGLEIGGLDKEVIRDPLTNRPYIPGSSLRGKMRSQTEKRLGRPQNYDINKIYIHVCQKGDEYSADGGCPVCHVFGVPANMKYQSTPARLIVRDAIMSDISVEQLKKARTPLDFTELKTEVAIDRVTSAATPRTIERVPAGAEFGPLELVFGIYEQADYGRLKTVIEALLLVEDDYIGGYGSRGSGKVQFKEIKITGRASADYSTPLTYKTFNSVGDLAADFAALQQWMSANLPVG